MNKKVSATGGPAHGWNFSFGSTSLIQRALFAKNMSVMIKAGLPITEALSIAEESMTGKFKVIIADLLRSVEAGAELSSGLKLYPTVFSTLFVNAVYAGERSGTLEENLEYVAEQLRKEKELNSKIKGAMLYPIVILVASFILGLAISFFILPKIIPLFEGMKMELPITTRGLIWFSHVMDLYGVWIVIGATLDFIFLVWICRQKFSRPVTNWLLLHIPVLKSLTRNANIARFCRTMGTLIRSGLTIDEAMGITSETVGNYYYEKSLREAASHIGAGVALSECLAPYEKLYPKMVTRMIHVGEESGKLEESLLYLARYFEGEVDNDTKTLSTAIEPALLLFIGVVVGFLALSIITPIYNITGNIGR